MQTYLELYDIVLAVQQENKVTYCLGLSDV